MTKQLSDENSLKYQLATEANKVKASIDSLIENPHLAICNTHGSREKESQFKDFQIETTVMSEPANPGKLMIELFNLENWVESETPVKIKLDLDLYQMEH